MPGKDFKAKYIEEAFDIIGVLESTILKLEEQPGNSTVIEEVFRAMHTLKGGAAMFGFNAIRDITHELEDIYDSIRSGKITIIKDLLNITLESIDYFKRLLGDDSGKNKTDEKYHNQLLNRIIHIRDSKTDQNILEPEPVDKNENTLNKTKIVEESGKYEDSENKPAKDSSIKSYHIVFQPGKDLIKNGTNPLLLISEIISLGEALVFTYTRNVPDLKNLVVDELYIYWHIVLSTWRKDEIAEVFIFVQDDSKIEINKISDGNILKDKEIIYRIRQAYENGQEDFYSTLQQYTIQSKTDIKTTEQLEKEPEITIESPEAELINNQDVLSENQESSQEIETGIESSKRKTEPGNIPSIRVAADKIDKIMNLVSQLMPVQARLTYITSNQKSSELQHIAENIERLSRNLRDAAINLSLVPVKSLVLRFQRLVRDLSATLKKNVSFDMEGTDTELDKNIVENLTDPIMHIIRNCIDHGIEDSESRMRLGKPEQGKIILKAYYSGIEVHIRISDDGRGIDPELIRARGIQLGLISKESVISDKDLFDLIFVPGFSTTDKITNISGRGFGMDIVKKKISEIHGEIEVESTLNKGTNFTLKIPLTLSIIDGLIVSIEDNKYVIPLGVVNKIYTIQHADLESSFFKLAVLNNKQIPCCNLRELFEIDHINPETELVIVVGNEDKQYGLVVDNVVGEYQAVLKPLGRHYKDQQMFSGATLLGDGAVALVIDTNKVVHASLCHTL